jgi:hypothetical protein
MPGDVAVSLHGFEVLMVLLMVQQSLLEPGLGRSCDSKLRLLEASDQNPWRASHKRVPHVPLRSSTTSLSTT